MTLETILLTCDQLNIDVDLARRSYRSDEMRWEICLTGYNDGSTVIARASANTAALALTEAYKRLTYMLHNGFPDLAERLTMLPAPDSEAPNDDEIPF
jgi:hypothetical protein